MIIYTTEMFRASGRMSFYRLFVSSVGPARRALPLSTYSSSTVRTPSSAPQCIGSPNKSKWTPMAQVPAVRWLGSGKDIMKGWNPTGENPEMEEGDSDQEHDDTVKVYQTKETRSDELIVVMNGNHVTLPIAGLYTQIRSMNMEQVLSMIRNSYNFLDKLPDAIPLSMRRLYFVCRKMNDEDLEYVRGYLPKEEQFKLLCALVARQGPDLEPDKAMDMLEYLHFFGLGIDHPAMKVYLQLAMSFINDMHPDQIAKLADIVYSMKTNKVTTLLREGLKLAAKNLFPKDISALSMANRVTLLSRLGESMEKEFKSKLLTSMEEDAYQLKPMSALELMTGLSKWNIKNEIIQQECMEKIQPHADTLTPTQITSVLSALTETRLYAPDFLNVVCDQGDRFSDWSKPEILSMVKHCRTQGYFNSGLLSKTSEFISDDTLQFSDRLDLFLYHFDSRHASKNKVGLGQLEQDLKAASHENLSLDSVITWGLGMQLLDLPVPDLVAITLQSIKSLENEDIGDKSRLNLADKLLVLSQYMDAEQLQKIGKISSRSAWRPDSALSGALDYIASNMGIFTVQHGAYSKKGFHIDHVLEDKVEREGHSRVAVLYLPENNFMRNTGQLKGFPYLMCKTIQKEGFKVLVFNESSWHLINERDKMEYLLHKIKDVDTFQDLNMLGLDNLTPRDQ